MKNNLIFDYKTFNEDEGYSLEDLIKDVKRLSLTLAEQDRVLLKSLLELNTTIEIINIIYKYFFNKKTNVNSELYLLCHFSIADFSILKDYQVFKRQFDIIRGTLASCQKPIRNNGLAIFLRDTSNLADVRTSLEKLGESYGFPKLNIINTLNNKGLKNWL